MKRFGIAAAAALLLTMGTAGAQAPRTVLNVGIAAPDAGRLDPHLSANLQDKAVLSWMFNGLVRIRPGESNPGSIEPDLAREWSSNPAGTEWTFRLREGVQCHHDYGELTSDDVVYSLQRAADPRRSSFSADFAAFERVEAVDRYTVRIVLKNAVPNLLGIVSSYHGGNIVCRRAAEEAGENFQRRPIGTGPFMFAEYQPQRAIRLVANPAYFRGAPRLTEINYRFIPSEAARDLALRSEELDLIFGRQDEAWFNRMRAQPGITVIAMEPAEWTGLHLNMSAPPLNDIRVRRAILHAIDRRAMVQLRGANVAREATGVIPADNLGFLADPGLPAFDPVRARALLAEAGHPNGITLRGIITTLPSLLTAMEAVQAQLRRSGINLELEAVDHATYHARIRQNASQLTLYQAARFPVADVYLSQFYWGRSIVGTPTAVTNFSHCAVADDEIVRARSEQNAERQRALWQEAQRKIAEAACAAPLFENLQLWAYNSDLVLGYELRGALNLAPPITEATHFRN